MPLYDKDEVDICPECGRKTWKGNHHQSCLGCGADLLGLTPEQRKQYQKLRWEEIEEESRRRDEAEKAAEERRRRLWLLWD